MRPVNADQPSSNGHAATLPAVDGRTEANGEAHGVAEEDGSDAEDGVEGGEDAAKKKKKKKSKGGLHPSNAPSPSCRLMQPATHGPDTL